MHWSETRRPHLGQIYYLLNDFLSRSLYLSVSASSSQRSILSRFYYTKIYYYLFFRSSTQVSDTLLLIVNPNWLPTTQVAEMCKVPTCERISVKCFDSPSLPKSMVLEISVLPPNFSFQAQRPKFLAPRTPRTLIRGMFLNATPCSGKEQWKHKSGKEVWVLGEGKIQNCV